MALIFAFLAGICIMGSQLFTAIADDYRTDKQISQIDKAFLEQSIKDNKNIEQKPIDFSGLEDFLGNIEFKEAGIKTTLRDNASYYALDHSAGLYTDSAPIDQKGTSIILGHNYHNGSNDVFTRLDEVKPSHTVDIKYLPTKTLYRYEVQAVYHIDKLELNQAVTNADKNTTDNTVLFVSCDDTFYQGESNGRILVLAKLKETLKSIPNTTTNKSDKGVNHGSSN